jgi:hypothetical protein
MNDIEIIKEKTSEENLLIDVSYLKSRVQEIRFFAAMLESGFSLLLNSTQRRAFQNNPRYIFKSSKLSPKKLNIIIDHNTPFVIIGSIQKQLIFPKWLFDTPNLAKKYEITFSGAPTIQRVTDAIAIYEFQPGVRLIILKLFKKLLVNFRNRITTRILNSLTQRLTSREKKLRWTLRGRSAENKLFDSAYFEEMAQSKYVYCPSGDFLWTYRFYEAIICGSFPLQLKEDVMFSRLGLYTKRDIENGGISYEFAVSENKIKIFNEVVAFDDLKRMKVDLLLEFGIS